MHDLQFLGKVANTLGYSDENVNFIAFNIVKLSYRPSENKSNKAHLVGPTLFYLHPRKFFLIFLFICIVKNAVT